MLIQKTVENDSYKSFMMNADLNFDIFQYADDTIFNMDLIVEG